MQIYFVDSEEKQLEIRSKIIPDLNVILIEQLQKMLDDHNNYIRDFKSVREALPRLDDFDVSRLHHWGHTDYKGLFKLSQDIRVP